MINNYILFLIYSVYFWTILSTIRVFYNNKVGSSIISYRKLVPFIIYHIYILIMQLLYIIPISYFMNKYNYSIFVWKQLSWNFRILFPFWFGSIKFYGLKNISTSNYILIGNYESIIDPVILMLIPTQIPIINTNNYNYLLGSSILPLNTNYCYESCKEVLNNGMSINIFFEKNNNKEMRRKAYDISYDTNVPIISYTIKYKRMNMSVRFNKPIYPKNNNYMIK